MKRFVGLTKGTKAYEEAERAYQEAEREKREVEQAEWEAGRADREAQRQEWINERFLKTFTYKVIQTLKETEGNLTQAAKLLGVSRTHIYTVLKRYKRRGKKYTVYSKAKRGRPEKTFKKLTKIQVEYILHVMGKNTAYKAKVSYKKPESCNNRHPTKGWYSKSIMELVKRTYDINISYATANRILHHAFPLNSMRSYEHSEFATQGTRIDSESPAALPTL